MNLRLLQLLQERSVQAALVQREAQKLWKLEASIKAEEALLNAQPKRCQYCRVVLPVEKRKDALYCSRSHKVMFSRLGRRSNGNAGNKGVMRWLRWGGSA